MRTAPVTSFADCRHCPRAVNSSYVPTLGGGRFIEIVWFFRCVASVAEIQWSLAFGFFAQKSSIWSNNLLASQPPSLR
jgi:hypothetical protein